MSVVDIYAFRVTLSLPTLAPALADSIRRTLAVHGIELPADVLRECGANAAQRVLAEDVGEGEA